MNNLRSTSPRHPAANWAKSATELKPILLSERRVVKPLLVQATLDHAMVAAVRHQLSDSDRCRAGAESGL